MEMRGKDQQRRPLVVLLNVFLTILKHGVKSYHPTQVDQDFVTSETGLPSSKVNIPSPPECAPIEPGIST